MTKINRVVWHDPAVVEGPAQEEPLGQRGGTAGAQLTPRPTKPHACYRAVSTPSKGHRGLTCLPKRASFPDSHGDAVHARAGPGDVHIGCAGLPAPLLAEERSRLILHHSYWPSGWESGRVQRGKSRGAKGPTRVQSRSLPLTTTETIPDGSPGLPVSVFLSVGRQPPGMAPRMANSWELG